jgi:uncharacterized alkaline shock family protein YloU
VTVEVNLALEWGARAPDVGTVVQRSVTEHLERTAKLPAFSVDVVAEGVAGATAGS